MNLKKTGIHFLVASVLAISLSCRTRPSLPPEPAWEETRPSRTLKSEEDETLWGGEALTRDPEQISRSRMSTLSSFQEEYLIGAGDIIEIIYNFRYELTPDEYIMEVQDDIQIELLFNPDFSRKVRIRMDGKITMPLIGEIVMVNRNTGEIKKEITEKYARFIKDPEVSVVVEKGNIKIEELKKAITTAPRGQSKIVPVRPDGKITLPLIGDVQAAGLTVPELRYEVNRQYAKLVRNLDTTVIIEAVKSPKIFVLGEVFEPGVYETPAPVTSAQAIAMAKGLKDSASESSIIILRDVGLPAPRGIKINLDDVFDMEKSKLAEEWEERRLKIREKLRAEGKEELTPGVYAELGDWTFIHNDIVLKRNDIVYVPKTFIAEANTFIEQVFTKGIYSLLPADSTLDFILKVWDVGHIGQRTSVIVD